MSKLGPHQFNKGEQLIWTDPDESGVVQPHWGKVVTWTSHEDSRVYLMEEKDETTQNGLRLVFVLEEELSRLTMH